MELTDKKVIEITGEQKGIFEVVCGWKKCSSGEREFLMLETDREMKLISCKESDKIATVRPECNYGYTKAEVKAMKREFNSYMKKMKHEAKLASA